ncbi:protein TE40 [Testudinid alphaherpesvirus 3]|uniref:Protein TE40 n=1 Tax=Testudinid alphaherpesvirus 3 TaxID=2560801 RepID=A0A0M3MWW1_9ALPH|nr:protein TE40 [Testudinid alphaherpesvirus 3]AIU39347.1 protein TE40 [Testudinid alphaherpesvirus 3]AIU39441.1 protein TE40 [Testudinid alphaherpesvirus 3]AKI81716.1 protein TE40 [Testudinid alphaherpesvirus 3]AKI81817.1 protein TE40 [Testudinid alphaherpesvirus 3]
MCSDGLRWHKSSNVGNSSSESEPGSDPCPESESSIVITSSSSDSVSGSVSYSSTCFRFSLASNRIKGCCLYGATASLYSASLSDDSDEEGNLRGVTTCDMIIS